MNSIQLFFPFFRHYPIFVQSFFIKIIGYSLNKNISHNIRNLETTHTHTHLYLLCTVYLPCHLMCHLIHCTLVEKVPVTISFLEQSPQYTPSANIYHTVYYMRILHCVQLAGRRGPTSSETMQQSYLTIRA